MTLDVDRDAHIRSLENRLQVMIDAVREFAEATTDYERLLDIVARTLAVVVKDGCVVRMLSEGGWLSPVAVHLPFESQVHDREAIEKLRAHIALPHNLSEQASARHVIETGQAHLVPHLNVESLWSTTSPEIVRAFEIIGIHSLLFVALRVRGESIGLLALVRFAKDSHPFGERDRELAQALADHAALAISNARLLKTVMRELTDRQRAESALLKSEEQLRQAQKMEAVGRLAGGVAHDFNNLLSVILGYAELVGAELRPDDPLCTEVEQIKQAGLRATELTRRLLAFSRHQVFETKVLDLNQSVLGIEKMLRQLLGADVELTSLLAKELWPIKSDPSQIEQILMNLAVNARDAMPSGGRLTIETANVTLDLGYAECHHDVTPGAYVLLAMTDTGVGMDKATQAQIFEPFFTTKEKDKGTGLGLSTVYGIVKQSGGHIWVYSELGKGTTFKVYIPKTEEATERRESIRPAPESIRGKGTILLVEDDDQVRELARTILRNSGYVVLEAQNGGEALLIAEQHQARIHLLLTDVILPRMNGRQIAERIIAQRPDTKVLFMSGYTGEAILQHGMLESDVAYLQKPLTPASLTRKVREVLESD